MSEKQWILFFRQEAPHYLDNVFTKNTMAEVDFIIDTLGLGPGDSILDIGCGTGRHSLELARRGFRCTGIDQSEEMLAIARAIAEGEGLEVRFLQGDASATRLPDRFHHAICLCEGAFSLLEVGVGPLEYHEQILRNIHEMLEPGGMFLLTALNALRMIREHRDEDVLSGHFDLFTTKATETYPGPGGRDVAVVEKGFMPAELRGLLEAAGFHVLTICGGTAGSWNRKPLSLDEIEIMAVCRKR